MVRQSKKAKKEKYEKPILKSIKKEDLRFEAFADCGRTGESDRGNC